MKRVALIIAALLLASCAEIQAFRAGVGNYGAEAADQTLDTALWSICNGVPVGAINRRFKSVEEREAYRAICPTNVLPGAQ